LGRGNDTLHLGTGIAHIRTGSGSTHFVPAYGGLSIVDKWAAGQVYDLTAWPQRPVLTQTGDRAEFTLGLSILRVLGVPAGVDVRAQMRWGAADAP
jgi:hypothetical protein